ncbi:nicotinate (nicotinamide) nucleotide adenylyltransferase [Jeotgalibacillus campisalis]|uniref:Probable nicotinate-nucleotide adenylyltransferase n=1 Tax=Jeotgalibacillus campisalis TaxID=220754 RepID=A0A0C2VFF3_9BACL|nr:nicotinate (nicotinamide) nucleotide adenylyltransferase [Jeotgalibacillus campisalis]KIL43271.1 nicotinate-nucleotide adenylyltransferase [Jeotgalibacillus campisalis]
MKIGVFGSAFDPITLGHMVSMEMIADRRGFDKILLIPSSNTRVDKGRQLTANHHRMKMVELAIEDNPKFVADATEMEAAAWHSYTYFTMKALKEKFPEDDLYFVMGADNLPGLPNWEYGKELIENNKFVVVGREGYDMSDIIARDALLTKNEDKFDCLSKGVTVETSSSFIRSRILNDLSVRYLVPDQSLKYALENNLYSEQADE